jgi:hypothetical protein
VTDFAAPYPVVPDRRFAAGTVASLLLHGLLIAGLLFLTPLKALVVPSPQPVTVEIVTQQQVDALSIPRPATPQLSAPTSVETAPPAAPSTTPPATTEPSTPSAPASGVHVATNFYAARILNETGMAKIKRAFGTLAPSERQVQLCNIEGLEQIRRNEPTYDPDTLVPYAMSDPLTAGLTLSAQGAAFRSRRKWYGMAFKCTVAADLQSVTAFEFKLGTPIPPAEWEEHNLNDEDSDE